VEDRGHLSHPLPFGTAKILAMGHSIGVREITEPIAAVAPDPRETAALRFDSSRRVTLRFALSFADEKELEALRYARRSMIREERTRGLEWDEPSMEDPTFVGSEIRWFALVSQAAWCRTKIDELIARANRAIQEMTP
jgi:hypothetical protein